MAASSSDTEFDIIFDDEENSAGLDLIDHQNAMAQEASSNPLLQDLKRWARTRSTRGADDEVVKERVVENFRFYLLDCDSWTCRASNLQISNDFGRGDYSKETKGLDDPLESVMRLYGVDESGESVCCIVRGFRPAFYARTSEQMEDSDVELLLCRLNSEIRRNTVKYETFLNSPSQDPPILRIEKLESCSEVSGLDSRKTFGQLEGSLLKITCSLTMLVKEAAEILTSQVIGSPFASYKFQVLEADLKPAVRYMATQGVPCCSWIEAKLAVVASQENKVSRITYNGLVVCCDYDKICALSADKEPQSIPELRILSLDIEIFDPALLEDRKAPFPKPGTKEVKVVQIGNILRTVCGRGQLNGEDTESQVIFALDSCDPIHGAKVFTFDTEEEMLMAWRLFVVLADPDILTGYNLHQFDIPFLLARAKVLGLEKFPYFGKCVSTAMGYQKVPTSQKAINFINENADYFTKISGRVVFDMFSIIRREFSHWRLDGGWKLDEASIRLINERKLGVMFYQIPKLQRGGPASRCQLAEYCLRDAMLAIKLMLNLCKGKSKSFFQGYREKAKHQGCLLRFVTSRSDAFLGAIISLRAVKKQMLREMR